MKKQLLIAALLAASLRAASGAQTAGLAPGAPAPGRAATRETPPSWDIDPASWRETGNGAFESFGFDGFALAPAPKGREVEISARVTPRASSAAEYATIGLSAFDDVGHFWDFSLVKLPKSKASRPGWQLMRRDGNLWREGGGLKRTVRDGPGVWAWGRAYDMTLHLAPDGIEGTVRDAETGALVIHVRYEAEGLAPGAPAPGRAEQRETPLIGRPALHATGPLEGRVENVRFAVRGEVPDAWRVFPEYRAVGPETGIRGRATGFFHVEKIGGVDWAIDPIGRAVILAGVDWCNKRGVWCEALGYAPYGRHNATNYASTAEWAEETAGRLRDWGFTFLPCGADESMRYRTLAHADGADNLYFSHRLCAGGPDWRISEYKRAPGTALPNVFYPDFEAACDWWARHRCAHLKDDPWLVGYFIDNELNWRGKTQENLAGGIFDMVAAKPDTHPAKQALLAFMQERGLAESGVARSATAQDKREFLRLVAERYFAVTAAAIRKADPNHLVLGCRFAGGPSGVDPVVMEAAAKYCDVVSFNDYPLVDIDTGRVAAADRYLAAHERSPAPFLLTEWSFAALDSGLPCTHGAGQRFRTQAERAAAAALYLETILSMPFFVGHSFFRWVDEPALGVNKYFPENTNYGLVNERGEPYKELVATFARIQGDAAALRTGRDVSTKRPPGGRAVGASLPDAPGAKPAAATRDGGPPERERYFAAVGAPAVPTAGFVGFRQEAGGAWLLSNSLVRISGRVGSRYMADEIAYGGAPAVGRWGALLQSGDLSGIWVDVDRVTDVSFDRDDATGIVSATIRAEGGVAPAPAPVLPQPPRGVAGSPRRGVERGSASARFAITHRLSLAPGTSEILVEIVSLENLGAAPLRAEVLMMRPFAIEAAPGEAPGVPYLWKGPVEGYWRLSDGSRWGVASFDPGVKQAVLWRRESDGTQHPDVRCKAGPAFTLAPDETWTPPIPMSARIRLLPAGEP